MAVLWHICSFVWDWEITFKFSNPFKQLVYSTKHTYTSWSSKNSKRSNFSVLIFEKKTRNCRNFQFTIHITINIIMSSSPSSVGTTTSMMKGVFTLTKYICSSNIPWWVTLLALFNTKEEIYLIKKLQETVSKIECGKDARLESLTCYRSIIKRGIKQTVPYLCWIYTPNESWGWRNTPIYFEVGLSFGYPKYFLIDLMWCYKMRKWECDEMLSIQ